MLQRICDLPWHTQQMTTQCGLRLKQSGSWDWASFFFFPSRLWKCMIKIPNSLQCERAVNIMNFLNIFEGWKSCMRKEKGEWLIKTSKAGCAGCSRLRRRHPTLLQHIQQPGELTSPRPSLLSPGNTGCIHIRLRCLHIAVYTLQSSITNQPKNPHSVMLYT